MKLAWDPKVSAGHLLTALGLFVAAVAFVFNIQSDVDRVDVESRARDADLSNQIERTNDALDRTVNGLDRLEAWSREHGDK